MNLIKKIFSSYLLISVLFIGLIFRLISINQSFWLDETTTGYVAREYNINEIVNEFAPADFHPPLYYAVINLWSRVFGVSEVSLRVPSIIFGLLTVMLVYMIVREISGDIIFPKFAAAALLATSGLHIYYSQEARMYAMSAFLVAFLIYTFLKTIKCNPALFFILFSLGLVLNFLTDYLPNLIIPVFWLYALVAIRDKKWWVRFILTHLPFLIIFLMWFPYLQAQLNMGLLVKATLPNWWNVLGKVDVKEFLLVPVKFILGRISFTNKILYGVVTGGLTLFYAGILIKQVMVKRGLKTERTAILIWMWLMMPFILTFFIGLKVSVFSYFRLLFILPAFYILTALGLTKIENKFRLLIFLIFFWANIIFAGVYLAKPEFQREDWRRAISFIEDNSFNKKNSDSTSIVLFPASTGTEALRYYAPGLTYSIKTLPSGYNEIWLMRYGQPIFDPDDVVRQKVEKEGFAKTEERDFSGVVVWKYIND